MSKTRKKLLVHRVAKNSKRPEQLSRVSCKKRSKKFENFKGKRLCWRLFLKKVTGLKPVTQSIGIISSHIKD